MKTLTIRQIHRVERKDAPDFFNIRQLAFCGKHFEGAFPFTAVNLELLVCNGLGSSWAVVQCTG